MEVQQTNINVISAVGKGWLVLFHWPVTWLLLEKGTKREKKNPILIQMKRLVDMVYGCGEILLSNQRYAVPQLCPAWERCKKAPTCSLTWNTEMGEERNVCEHGCVLCHRQRESESAVGINHQRALPFPTRRVTCWKEKLWLCEGEIKISSEAAVVLEAKQSWKGGSWEALLWKPSCRRFTNNSSISFSVVYSYFWIELMYSGGSREQALLSISTLPS